ncbi:ORF6N domain-containing protein [Sulfuricurvum sp. RIFCSPLOWO2_12_FULL_43_24]|uniref:ORF6N domain-containing protein n=1 Tax=Sulfuricurvum sp. RIFCSPLOWO2_12_FULL_43_24 TaxID=1802247 RepID=UPI0008D0C07A|nr:ORF6N domain-containing protein [Sulfuricurvum sp. RIFCSPLOWO2_12_FULL_43_24]OHD87367.1 MAG: DNA-binding protein [Sulfuricurvum sp. RIFCSPLOWO2_12_43_5]OHD91021.1 MAG: DNA-binding protein [Sulfuricurvum sp. RIFCSPLOWO2_12_FULL_43_24]
MNEISIIDEHNIQNKIYTLRGLQVMLDRDLAELYGVETKVFNQAIKRNSERFPSDFMFQLTKDELENWRSQFVTSNKEKMGLRRAPYAFTEQGVSMLSAILKSPTAVDMSVKIIRTFVTMRKFISHNGVLFQKIDTIEQKLLKHDAKFNQLFSAIESKDLRPDYGIFYEDQIFDAYVFVSDLIKSAKRSIVLIDNYVDESVLVLLTKRADGCKATIYTKMITSQLSLDLKKHNAQYPPIQIKEFSASHDRFVILDDEEIYHIGASLKDLGKKWFAFSKFEKGSIEMLGKLQ